MNNFNYEEEIKRVKERLDGLNEDTLWQEREIIASTILNGHIMAMLHQFKMKENDSNK